MGLLVYYASINRFFYIVLTAIVMTGSVMVSYTRARAENTIPKCKVGFLERPERVVLIIIGRAGSDRMAPVLWVIAVLSNVTVIAPHDLHLAGGQALEDAQLRRPVLGSRRLPPQAGVSSLVFQNHVRHAQFRGVGDGERTDSARRASRRSARPLREAQRGLAGGQVGHFEILPA